MSPGGHRYFGYLPSKAGNHLATYLEDGALKLIVKDTGLRMWGVSDMTVTQHIRKLTDPALVRKSHLGLFLNCLEGSVCTDSGFGIIRRISIVFTVKPADTYF